MKRLFNKKSKKIIKVILPGVLFLIVLFSLFSISNNKTFIDTLARMVYGDNEVELDNWEISTVFYDSTVNDGKTPLTEINWNVESTEYNYSETREITIQINYKNTGTVTYYPKESLNIQIDPIFPNGTNTLGYYFPNVKYNIGANSSQHTGYDWKVKSTNIQSFTPTSIILTNDKEFDEHTNFEGSIQIKYTLSTRTTRPNKFDYEKDLSFLDNVSCRLYSGENEINSNVMTFNFNRHVVSNWVRRNYTLDKKASKIVAIDGLPNYNDYTWVIYNFEVKDGVYQSERYYPNISSDKVYIEDTFPEGVVVLDSDYNILESQNQKYIIPNEKIKFTEYNSYTRYSGSIIAGYPNSDFLNVGNTNVQNVGKLYVKYEDRDDYEYADDGVSNINLNDFVFTNNANLYDVEKHFSSSGSGGGTSRLFNASSIKNLYYDNLIGRNKDLGNKGILTSYLAPYSVYLGEKYDLKVCDDLLYISSNNSDGYRKLNESEYYYEYISFPGLLYNGNGKVIPADKYKIKLYLKYRGSNNYVLHDTFYNKDNTSDKIEWNFDEDDKVSAFYFYFEDIEESLKNVFGNEHIFSRVVINNASDIPTTGKVYNFAYIEGYKNNNYFLAGSNINYPNFALSSEIRDFDIDTYGHTQVRFASVVSYTEFTIKDPSYSIDVTDENRNIIDDSADSKYIGTNNIKFYPLRDGTLYNDAEILYTSGISDDKRIDGYAIHELLPNGVNVSSSVDEIKSSLIYSSSLSDLIYVKKDGTKYDFNQLKTVINNNLDVQIINNYRNSGRTLLRITIDFGEPLILVRSSSASAEYSTFTFNYKWEKTYDAVQEYGNSHKSAISVTYLNKDTLEYNDVFKCYSHFSTFSKSDKGYITKEGEIDEDAYDINNNGNADELLCFHPTGATVQEIISTHQDVQVSVRSDKSNFDTGKVDSSNDSIYTYKLRVRTGTSDATNLVIYDSLEKYAKDPNMDFVSANGANRSWQGSFLGVDTSFAESKGYNVKVYYSEKVDPGNLKSDDSWNLYTDSVDKSKVKSLAFEYLDSEGNPAILPLNSLTYVLINMKSPTDESIKTFAYNGCWTEWNAIDPITGDVVDFITGINSNIVKVGLPNSVEPVDIDLEVNKYWVDANNKLGKRPESINVQLVPDGDITKAVDVPLNISNVVTGNSKRWRTTISVPKYDLDGNTITYTVREDEILLEDGYKYTPSIDNNYVTNTLMREIELKKIWVDNNNSNLTRPGNVTYILKQNGNNYKEIAVTGDYSTNEWTEKVTVPVFDSSNREYTYSIEEVNVDGYSSSCNDFVCTNSLVGDEDITITKVWNDRDNEYSTRPNSITIKLLQNNNFYRDVTISSTDNWTKTINVPKYDNNGARCTYTIEEDVIDEYGLVEYNQNSLTVSNSLKSKTNLVIKKIWVDDNNSSNTRPDELTITLLRDGANYKTVTLSGDTNEWITTVEVDKYADDFHKYIYSIKEVNDSIKDEYSDVTYSENDLSVTNKLNKNIDLTITKKWIDQDNKYSTRPESVSINLLQNGNLFRELNVTKDNNWKMIVDNVPMYDNNGAKYNYTIVENNVDEKYGNITYDQTNLEVTNELTEEPKVTLYFTVVNGYVDPATGEMKYDDFGFAEVLKKHNLDPEKEYTFKFLLENTDTNKKYEGNLSTHGILEFKDIPYGTYKAIETDDIVFEFFDMMSIENVDGVTFKKVGKTGYITINPTGEDIIYGAKIINRVKVLTSNPKTMNNILLVISSLIAGIIVFVFIKRKKISA